MKKMFIIIFGSLVTVVIAIALTILFTFSSKDHSEFDLPKHKPIGMRTDESVEHKAIVTKISEELANTPKLGFKEQIKMMREQADARGLAFNINAEVRPADAGGVAAEWVIAPNADLNRRMLYIHGGGYMVGSPKSHRLITSRMSEISNSAILVVDYRLIPEHSRLAGLEDMRTAYVWMINNAADGERDADIVMIAGDSSGGSMALATIAWVRDEGLRAANAVIALSPQTDITLSSPSLINNTETDVLQGKSFGPIVKTPSVFRLGFSYFMHRINPSKPIVSPLLGDLSDLPPTLIQASEAEMFLDDAVRYVNKANAHGSKAVLQTWPFMMHVWHAFKVPEANEAYSEIEAFIEAHTK